MTSIFDFIRLNLISGGGLRGSHVQPARPAADTAAARSAPGRFLTVSTGIDFPHAAQAVPIRRRHRLDQPRRFTTETVYAITNLHVHQARPAQLAAWIRRHRHIEKQIH
ncbi:hypothetical protein [Streptomyces sp. NPDC050535]|uniref:hypothetical protein n=1 Tax=Streptomyces sp. NPDC050535 TaxID=3365626 RepID=UPI0037B57346